MPTPTLNDLARVLDRTTIAELLDLAQLLLGDVDTPFDQTMREALRDAVEREGVRHDRLVQLEFDLRAARKEALLVSECMSPPRWWIRDYAAWLRAGGGRPVNALCAGWCPCGGAGPEWLRAGA